MSKCSSATLEQRLMSKVNKTKSCWVWMGSTVGKGYGLIGTDRGNKLTHRVAYEMYVGPIADGMFVLHRCDNPKCVNPKHLFQGTNTDNMRDMMSKGRGNKPRGEQISLSKLTAHDVQLIKCSLLSARELAYVHGVNACTIYRIKNSQTWSHV